MKPGDSLVSTISRPNDQIVKFSGQHVDPLRAAAVLTCLVDRNRPTPSAPTYCDAAHGKVHLARDLRRELLLKLPKPRSAPPKIDAYRVASNGDRIPYGPSPAFNAPNYVATFQRPLAGHVSSAAPPPWRSRVTDRKSSRWWATPACSCTWTTRSKRRSGCWWALSRPGSTSGAGPRRAESWPSHGGLEQRAEVADRLRGDHARRSPMQSPTKTLPDLHFHEDDQTALCPYSYRGAVPQDGLDRGPRRSSPAIPCPATWPPGSWGRTAGAAWMFTRRPVAADEAGQRPLQRRHAAQYQQLVDRQGLGRPAHACREGLGPRRLLRLRGPLDDRGQRAVCRGDQASGRHGLDQGQAGDLAGRRVMQAKFVHEMWDQHRNHLPPAPDKRSETPPAEETWR